MMIWIRRALIALVSLLALAAVVVAALVWNGERKRERVVQLPALLSPAFTRGAARERGAYLYASRGCTDCHGADGAGRVFVDDGKGLKIRARPSLRPRQRDAGYTPQDWDRTVRHGVGARTPGDGDAERRLQPLHRRRLRGPGVVRARAAAGRWRGCRGRVAAAGACAVRRLASSRTRRPRSTMRCRCSNRCPRASRWSMAATSPTPAWVAMARSSTAARYRVVRPTGPRQRAWSKGADSAMTRYPNADAWVTMFRSGKRADGSEIKVDAVRIVLVG